jgi:hypothetical protein
MRVHQAAITKRPLVADVIADAASTGDPNRRQDSR